MQTDPAADHPESSLKAAQQKISSLEHDKAELSKQLTEKCKGTGGTPGGSGPSSGGSTPSGGYSTPNEGVQPGQGPGQGPTANNRGTNPGQDGNGSGPSHSGKADGKGKGKMKDHGAQSDPPPSSPQQCHCPPSTNDIGTQTPPPTHNAGTQTDPPPPTHDAGTQTGPDPALSDCQKQLANAAHEINNLKKHATTDFEAFTDLKVQLQTCRTELARCNKFPKCGKYKKMIEKMEKMQMFDMAWTEAHAKEVERLQKKLDMAGDCVKRNGDKCGKRCHFGTLNCFVTKMACKAMGKHKKEKLGWGGGHWGGPRGP